MKSNAYFRTKTSAPTIQLQAGGSNSLAALMGRFQNDSQNQDYCLRAKPSTAGYSNTPLLTSKYNQNYDQGSYINQGRNYQTLNKENVWGNAPNPNESRYKQLTPTRRQQPVFVEKKEVERSRSKSPIGGNNSYSDNKFVFKAKQNKTLGNLIQLAETYQQQTQYQTHNPVKCVISPNKVYIGKRQSNNEESYFGKQEEDCKLTIGLKNEQLEKQISSLKELLVNISLQSLPKQAVESAVHIQIQDFLQRLIPSRTPVQKPSDFKKKQSSTLMQTSNGMPVHFSFDVSYQQFIKGTDASSSDKMESSIEQNNSAAGYQTDGYLLCENSESTTLLSSKTEQMLRQL